MPQERQQANVPALAAMVDAGWDIVAPIPSRALTFKQELPLLFPDDAEVKKMSEAIFYPFEYPLLHHKDGKLNTDFKVSLGKVAYHATSHQPPEGTEYRSQDPRSAGTDSEHHYRIHRALLRP